MTCETCGHVGSETVIGFSQCIMTGALVHRETGGENCFLHSLRASFCASGKGFAGVYDTIRECREVCKRNGGGSIYVKVCEVQP